MGWIQIMNDAVDTRTHVSLLLQPSVIHKHEDKIYNHLYFFTISAVVLLHREGGNTGV
jgi:hypothetical protein